MAVPEICEQPPPQAAIVDANGLTVYRRWSILAYNEVDAIFRLKVSRGVFRGSAMVFPGADTPQTICQQITAVGKPPALNAGGGGLGQYIVDATFQTVFNAPKQPQPGKPAVWRVRSSLQSTPRDKDADGKSILSSSLEPFDPPLTRLQPNEVLHGEFYVQGTDELEVYKLFRPFHGRVNSADLARLGVEKECLLFHPIITEPTDMGYVKVSVDLEYREPQTTAQGTKYGGWVETPLDMGTRRLAGSANFGDPTSTSGTLGLDSMFVRLRDSQGITIGAPVPMDGNGQTMDFQTFHNLGGGKPIVVRLYKTVDFNTVPWPTGSI
jgi:hypothetical protein